MVHCNAIVTMPRCVSVVPSLLAVLLRVVRRTLGRCVRHGMRHRRRRRSVGTHDVVVGVWWTGSFSDRIARSDLSQSVRPDLFGSATGSFGDRIARPALQGFYLFVHPRFCLIFLTSKEGPRPGACCRCCCRRRRRRRRHGVDKQPLPRFALVRLREAPCGFHLPRSSRIRVKVRKGAVYQ